MVLFIIVHLFNLFRLFLLLCVCVRLCSCVFCVGRAAFGMVAQCVCSGLQSDILTLTSLVETMANHFACNLN